MTLAGRDSGDLSMTFRDLKSFGARLSGLSRTLAGDPQTRVSDLKFQTLFGELPVRALAVAGVSGRLQKSDLVKESVTPGCLDALSPESGETVWNPALSRRALPRIWGERVTTPRGIRPFP